jgi:hypothetical protein
MRKRQQPLDQRHEAVIALLANRVEMDRVVDAPTLSRIAAFS